MKTLISLLLICFSLSSFSQVSKTNSTPLTISSGPVSGSRTFTYTAGDFGGCTSLTEVEIAITITMGSGTFDCDASGDPYSVQEDLGLRLTSPIGTSVDILFDKWDYFEPSLGNTLSSFVTVPISTVLFDDDAATTIGGDWNTFAGGSAKPVEAFSTFDGENGVGTWTLAMCDGNSQFSASDYFCITSSTLTVTCGVACTDPTVPTVTYTPGTICEGNNATLTISGTLNDATQWNVYTGSCGGTLLGSTAGSTFVVTPSAPSTTYYVRGEGGCVTPGSCGTVTVNVNALPTVTFTAPGDLCVTDMTQFGLGGGSPSGGTYSGPGVTDDGNGMTYTFDPATASAGIHTITYSYTDGNGCSSSANDQIEVISTTFVTFDPLSDVCLNSGVQSGIGNVDLTGGFFSGTGVTDDGNGMTFTFDPSVAGIGVHSIDYTTANPCTPIVSQTIEVLSLPSTPAVTSPMSVCPGSPIILGATGSGSGTLIFYNNIPAVIGTASMPPAFGTLNIGGGAPGTYTYGVTEDNGVCQSMPAAIVVNVEDVQAPTAVCQNITAFLDGAGNVTITAADIDGGSTDNCSGVTLSASQTSFTCANIGANSVTLTVTDVSSNTANCTAVVTIADTTSPVISCPGNQNETPNASCQYILPDYTGLVTASDNCSGSPSVTQSPVPGTVISGNTTITMTANDGSGNTSSCTFDIILLDATPPTAVCQNITVYLDGTGNATITAADIDGGSSDNCGGVTLSASQTSFTCADIGTNNVTLTVTDGNTNSDNCVAVVTVMDTVSPAPDVASLSDVTAECQVSSLVAPTASDNCGGALTGTHNVSLPITSQGTTVVTWTYDDGNGNTSTQMQNVVITDVTAPVPDNNTLNDVTAECEVTSLTDPTATDNCGGAVTVTNDASLPITTQGTTVVTWTYDDGNGNTSTQMQNVVITDVTAPVPDNNTLNDVTECFSATPTAPTATDNCAGAITGTPDVSFPITTPGTTLVTWTYDDGNGNTSTQTQNVIINTVDVNVSQSGTTYTADATGATYQWLDCDNNYAIISGETGQSFSPTAVGNYAVEVTDNGCTDTSACVYFNNVGLDIIDDLGIKVYPNPNTGRFTIEFNDQVESFVIYDGRGRVVMKENEFNGNKIDVNITDEQPGEYYIEFSGEFGKTTRKITLHK